jgi:DNA-binding response OmpR family regulator
MCGLPEQIMTRRLPLDDENEFAFWKPGKEAKTIALRRIIVGHADKTVGDSICLLLSLKGYEPVYAGDAAETRRYLKFWKPNALLIDTRLDAALDYQLVREIRADAESSKLLILAMSNLWPLDSASALRKAGFDGHCRRPCSLWRITDLLDGYFRKCT